VIYSLNSILGGTEIAECPEGYYCPEGTLYPHACPEGYYLL
jgi:hypothetical protein